jgi:hypothetical protein
VKEMLVVDAIQVGMLFSGEDGMSRWAERAYRLSGSAKFNGGTDEVEARCSWVALFMATKRWRWKERQFVGRLKPPVATPRQMAVADLDDHGMEAPSAPMKRSSSFQYMGAGRRMSLLTASLEPPKMGRRDLVEDTLRGSTKTPSRACRSGWWQKVVLSV